MRAERMYVSPAFKKKLKKEAADAEKTILQLTEDLAKDNNNIRNKNPGRKGIEFKVF